MERYLLWIAYSYGEMINIFDCYYEKDLAYLIENVGFLVGAFRNDESHLYY